MPLVLVKTWMKKRRESRDAPLLAADIIGKGSGRLTERMINHICDDVTDLAGVNGRTPRRTLASPKKS